jgi:hypothetical protein
MRGREAVVNSSLKQSLRVAAALALVCIVSLPVASIAQTAGGASSCEEQDDQDCTKKLKLTPLDTPLSRRSPRLKRLKPISLPDEDERRSSTASPGGLQQGSFTTGPTTTSFGSQTGGATTMSPSAGGVGGSSGSSMGVGGMNSHAGGGPPGGVPPGQAKKK